MSVSLLITKNGSSDQDRIIPIATESMFSDLWIPAALQLKLRYVPLFQSGLFIEREDISEVIAELISLRSFFAQHLGIKDLNDLSVHLISRIDSLIDNLLQLEKDTAATIYIG